MGNIHTTGPNQALVISGGLCGGGRTTVIGGWGWAWWCVSDVQQMSLEVMTLNPVCENVETAKGVPVTVTGVAQIKVMSEDEFLGTAAEQFIGKPQNEIEHILQMTMDGHLRGILATMTVETITTNRELFAQKVREVAAPDLGRMGMEILSFTIKDISDSVQYLDSLGRSQTAVVKRNANIGVAEAERDAGIKEAMCQREALDVKYQVDSSVANAERELKLKQAEFDSEVNSKRAEAELAYKLQAAKEQQRIRQEEIQIDIVERRKEISIEEKEIQRKEKELQGTVKLPAEAEAYRVQTIAEGKKAQVIEGAKAYSEKTRLIGTAEAASIEAVGRAEADGMRMKAAAYSKYGRAAMVQMVLEKMPLIAAEVSAPMSNIREMTILGGDSRTTELTHLMANLPVAVEALTGIDLTDVTAQAIQGSFGSNSSSKKVKVPGKLAQQ